MTLARAGSAHTRHGKNRPPYASDGVTRPKGASADRDGRDKRPKGPAGAARRSARPHHGGAFEAPGSGGGGSRYVLMHGAKRARRPVPGRRRGTGRPRTPMLGCALCSGPPTGTSDQQPPTSTVARPSCVTDEERRALPSLFDDRVERVHQFNNRPPLRRVSRLRTVAISQPAQLHQAPAQVVRFRVAARRSAVITCRATATAAVTHCAEGRHAPTPARPLITILALKGRHARYHAPRRNGRAVPAAAPEPDAGHPHPRPPIRGHRRSARPTAPGSAASSHPHRGHARTERRPCRGCRRTPAPGGKMKPVSRRDPAAQHRRLGTRRRVARRLIHRAVPLTG
jgi:hypothetical protein